MAKKSEFCQKAPKEPSDTGRPNDDAVSMENLSRSCRSYMEFMTGPSNDEKWRGKLLELGMFVNEVRSETKGEMKDEERSEMNGETGRMNDR